MKAIVAVTCLCTATACCGYEFTKPDGTKIELTVVGVQTKEHKNTSRIPTGGTYVDEGKQVYVSKVLFVSKDDPDKRIVTDIDKLTEADAALIREWCKNRTDYARDDGKWVKMGRRFVVPPPTVDPLSRSVKDEKVFRVDGEIFWIKAATYESVIPVKHGGRIVDVDVRLSSTRIPIAIKIGQPIAGRTQTTYVVGDRFVGEVRQIGIITRDGGDFPLCIRSPRKFELVSFGVNTKTGKGSGELKERETIGFDEYVKAINEKKEEK